jgi:hypothetical protein
MVRNQYNIAKNEIFMAFVGRLAPEKNPRGALDVVADLPDRYRLVMAGDGSMRENLTSQISNLEINSRVELTGRLSHESALRLIAASDLLILTSHIESYAGVVYEALALRTPVFATPVANLAEFEHSRLHTGSVEALPRLMLRNKFHSRTGVDEHILKNHSISRYTDKIISAFISVTSDKISEKSDK